MRPSNTSSPQKTVDKENYGATLKTLLLYIWQDRRSDLRIRLGIAMLCLVLGKVINVVVPFLLKVVIDRLSLSGGALTLPLGLILAFGLARLGALFFSELRDYVFVNVAQHTQRQLSLRTFSHLHTLSLDFHLSRQTGGLSRVIERASRSMQFVLRFLVFNVFPTLVEIFFVIGILFFTFNFQFALAGFITLLLYIAATFLITDLRLRYRRSMNEEDTQANTKAIDSLLNYETVKYFGNEQHELRRYDASLARYEVAAIKSQFGLSTLNFAQGFVISLGLVALMILAGKGVVENTLTVGDFVLVHTLLMQLFMPLNFLGVVYREIKEGLLDMSKMFDVLKIEPLVQDQNNAPDLNLTGGRIEFRSVSFYYNPNRPILRNVSFTLDPGKTLAIVGPSGAGKSTIARLLFRFYDVQEGQILIDGQDIAQVRQDTVRGSIGVVPQDTVLFNDTIEYNIRYGRPDASHDEIVRAAKMAHIHFFIESLPDGYETKVGERGLKLSGGEKQRVAIARTILKDPSILIFDEATSALDSHTEKEIQAALSEVSRNHTTLMVAHRLSTVVDADEILVLDRGQIIERGKHDELLRLKGEYAKMWAAQQEVLAAEAALQRAKQKQEEAAA